MKAISIRQPWAWLILRPCLTDPISRAAAIAAGEIKLIENRDWPTKVRGRVLVHAAKGMTHAEYESVKDFLQMLREKGIYIALPEFSDFDRGGIVGSVEIVDCVSASASPWFFGKFGFVLRDSQPMPFIPMNGRLGFFEVDGVDA